MQQVLAWLNIQAIQYLGGLPNLYTCAGITYPALDLFFRPSCLGGTVRPQDLDPAALPFPSLQKVWAQFSPQ